MEQLPNLPLELLDRYIAGEVSVPDREQVELWLGENPANEAMLVAMRQVRVAPHIKPITPDKHAALNKLRQTIEVPAKQQAFYGNARTIVLTACIILAAVIGIKYVPFTQPTPETKTYSTTNAQRSTISLADGSEITLAPATTLRITGREVNLTGEALFKVTQRENSPFVVKAGNTITKVLGTEFSVRAYQGPIRVAVRSGKVAVNDEILNENDVAYEASSKIQVVRDANIEPMFSFATGSLIFRNVALRDAISDLNRWYDVDIRVTDVSIASMPLTAEVSGTSVQDLTRSISLVLGVRAARNGRIIIITR